MNCRIIQGRIASFAGKSASANDLTFCATPEQRRHNSIKLICLPALIHAPRCGFQSLDIHSLKMFRFQSALVDSTVITGVCMGVINLREN